MTVKSFTHHTCNEDGFEEATFEFAVPWYSWAHPFKTFVRYSDGLWRYKDTGKPLSDAHTVLLHAYLTC